MRTSISFGLGVTAVAPGGVASCRRPNPHRCASLTRSLLLLVALLGTSLPARAYDFADTCASGQVLYYNITDNTNHTVSVTYPYTGGGDSPDRLRLLLSKEPLQRIHPAHGGTDHPSHSNL